MLRVLTLSTLFPDATRPTFGMFVERQTLELAARPDVELQVVAPVGVPPGPLKRHPRYRDKAGVPPFEVWKGLTVHRPRFPVIPFVGGRYSPAWLAWALRPLIRHIRTSFPFDVIDAEFFYPDGPAAARLARELGVPFSIKARGADIHHWADQPGCREQIVEAGKAAGGLLAVSAALKADMVALGLPEERIRVHYTGVDLDRFRLGDRASAKSALGVAGPLLLTIGHLIERKGQAIAIEAMRLLPEATLWIVGEGPDRAALEGRIAVAGLGDRVRLLGAMPHKALPQLLAAADILVQPSASEGLANVWVEALACGTPVVTPDVGGAREVIDRSAAGRLVPREPEAIALAVRELLATPPAPADVRATAERFTWAANSAALYAHLAGISAA
jgi:teichuronic acid biosynthesis glycosyltransferase TuaC